MPDLHDRARRVLWKGGAEATQHPALLAPGYPRFLASGDGCRIRAVDGNEYVDYLMSWGAVFLGHRHPAVEEAVARQLERGALFNLQVEAEVTLAERLVRHIPGAELVRFVASGSEATQAAVRIARAATGRPRILRYGFHGWLDWCQNDHPAGILPDTLAQTEPMPYNDLQALDALFAAHPGEIAAVIMEPAKAELPGPGYLDGVRQRVHAGGALLILDEVKTGFRLGLGGAQGRFGVTPDLSVFSKALANGYPLAAVCGRSEVFERANDVWISGTYHAWPPALAAAHATLTVLEQEPVVERVWALGERLMAGFNGVMAAAGLAGRLGGLPPMPEIRRPEAEAGTLATICSGLARRGYFVHPVRPWFLSAAHDAECVERTLVDLDAVTREAVSP